MTEFTTQAPADVVTSVSIFLRNLGYNAAPTVPDDKPPKTVRVSRTGGGPVDQTNDRADVLIETWHLDNTQGFEFAREIWALFASISREDQEALPGIISYEVVPQVPTQYQDPNSEKLVRYQFMVSILYRMPIITINPNTNNQIL